MKRIVLVLFVLFNVLFHVSAQYYVGHTTSSVNMRSGASTSSSVISNLNQNSVLFVDLSSSYNGFYHVVNVKNDKEGYVSRNYVCLDEEIEAGNGSQIVSTGRSSSYNAQLQVYNNTGINMTLKVGNKTYYFTPMERRWINVEPGNWKYQASAPGVIPCVGTKYFSSYEEFEWEFYIATTRW